MISGLPFAQNRWQASSYFGERQNLFIGLGMEYRRAIGTRAHTFPYYGVSGGAWFRPVSPVVRKMARFLKE